MGLSELHCKLGILKLRHKPLSTFFSPHIGKTPIDCNRRTWCALQREIISSVLETTQNQTILAERPLFHYAFHFSFTKSKVQLKQELNMTTHFCEK